jgi:hypothetical protein
MVVVPTGAERVLPTPTLIGLLPAASGAGRHDRADAAVERHSGALRGLVWSLA